MLIPLLNVTNTVIKLPKNNITGAVNTVDSIYSVQRSYPPKHSNVKDDVAPHSPKLLLPAFPDNSNFTIHVNDSNKSQIQLQDANMPLDIQQKLNNMLTSKFAEIISKSPADFGRRTL